MIKKIGKKFFEILTKVSPKLSAIVLYIYRTKEIPNLKNPKNFNEKMTKLKLSYTNNEMVSKCSDKYEVREYVKSKGLESILNELYFVCDKVEDIDFNKLPNQFALKCTHGCAYNVICGDKRTLNIEETKRKLNGYLNEKYGLATQELHYLNIKPRIICEKYLCDESGKMPIDYKIYCFNGRPECILVCSEREKKLKLSYYDLKWKRLNYEKKNWSSRVKIDKPKNLEKMLNIARQLSEEFEFVRVDLYNKDGEIIFGELTFTPACCCAPYYTKEGNEKLGDLIKKKGGGKIENNRIFEKQKRK